jgi:hypothetical protein
MQLHQARALLNRFPALQRACDLDLFVFLAKHPRTLMAREHLARLLGYQFDEIARSLDVLLAAGFLTRAQNPTGPARLYVFQADDMSGGPMPAIVELASTREGRLALRLALTQSPAGTAGGDASGG